MTTRLVMRARLKSEIPEIIAKSETAVHDVIQRSLDRIERGAKERSRVDTGNMRAGWESRMEGIDHGVVFNLVDYTIYNEYGTMFMAAQPMLGPAVEEERSKFAEELALVYEVPTFG